MWLKNNIIPLKEIKLLKQIEKQLEERGYTPQIRKAIRNSKICIIDDKIEDLKSLIEGLRSEGFTHLVEMNRIESLNILIEGDYDLIILDLTGVATEISSDDGIGILAELKKVEPALPVLVVSGATTAPILAKKLSLADSIRAEPVLPADLAADVENLLKYRKDEFWGALSILKELRRLQPELAEKLKLNEKIKLKISSYYLKKDLKNSNHNIVRKMIKISGIVLRLGTLTMKIVEITKGFSAT